MPNSAGSALAEPASTPDRVRRHWPVLLLLVASLAVTALATRQTQQKVVANAQLEFVSATNEISLKVTERMEARKEILLGGAGLFAASDGVTRGEWHAYVQSLRVETNLPGVLGVGYAQIVPPEHLAQHEQEIHQEGFTNYHVWHNAEPKEPRPAYNTAIIYLEPPTGRNLRAFG